jgi:hypothetical protein
MSSGIAGAEGQKLNSLQIVYTWISSGNNGKISNKTIFLGGKFLGA